MRVFEPYEFLCPHCGVKLKSDKEGLLNCAECRRVFEAGQNRRLARESKAYKNALIKSAPEVYTVAAFSYGGEIKKDEQRTYAGAFDYITQNRYAKENRTVFLPLCFSVAKADGFLNGLIAHEAALKSYRSALIESILAAPPCDKRSSAHFAAEFSRYAENVTPSAELREALERSEELYSRGASYYYEGKFGAAVENLRASAEMGHEKAQYLLAMCYASGDGVEKSLDGCVKWMKAAAEQGDSDAQFELGMLYGNGKLGIKDLNESAKWHRKAAEQGDKRSQGILGIYFLKGFGTRQSYVEALRWIRKSAAQGYSEGQCLLGAMYADGHGVIKNYEEARKWYKKAIAQGNDLAVEQLKSLEKEVERERYSAVRNGNARTVGTSLYSSPDREQVARGAQNNSAPQKKGSVNCLILALLLFFTGPVGAIIYLLAAGSRNTRVATLVIVGILVFVLIIVFGGTGACRCALTPIFGLLL